MNKKVSRILLLLLALLSAVSIANATEQREAQRKTGLSFSGTTAYCYANCKSDNHEDKVTANVMLYQGSNVIASWSAQGIGSVTISETAQVKKGYEYTMSLTWSVAGQWQRVEQRRFTAVLQMRSKSRSCSKLHTFEWTS